MGSLQDLPSHHFTPSFLSSVNSWHGHLPFAYDLVALQKPSLMVELGVHFGDSYFTFCQAVSEQNIKCKCFGIDTWKGDHQSGEYGDEVWDKVRNYNNSNYDDFSSLIRNSFANAVSQFEDCSIDLLHIDGLHTYDAVKEDFATWIPKVKTGGIVLLHDIEERKEGFGAWKFWDEIKNSYPVFSFSHDHGLGVLFNQSKGQKVDWYVERFDKFNLLNNYYQARAKLVKGRSRSRTINLGTNSPDSMIDDLTDEVDALQASYDELENSFNQTIDQNIQLSDKVRRMRNSFSWQITSPVRFFRRKLLDPFLRKGSKRLKRNTYQEWVAENDTLTDQKIKKLSLDYQALKTLPKLSIILPVHKIAPEILSETILSVKEQIYQNWELVIVDDCSNSEVLKKNISEYAQLDSRILPFFLNDHCGIADVSNFAIKQVSGDYVLFLDHDDLLRKHSLLKFVEAIEGNPAAKLIYSDEDKINLFGNRVSPHFKPDWNPDLLLSQNYICHLCCVSTNLVRKIGGFRSEFEGCQDWDLILRATERLTKDEILHIPEILYHWRKGRHSTSSNVRAKPDILKNSLKVIESALQRREVSARVYPALGKNNYVHIKYNLPEEPPLVSIIIPIRDRVDLLEKCLAGVADCNIYQNFEVIIMDNGSTERRTLSFLNKLQKKPMYRVISQHGPFNYSKINNEGAHQAKGSFLLFLNNDVFPVNNSWLEEMVSHASRPEVGCVGAKLFYPDRTIQHAGVVFGLGGVAGHAFRRFPENHPGYMSRLQLVQNYSAVTAACLMVRKNIFFEVNGFDEENLAVAFNDVDLCLKIKELGYWNLWTPHAQLFHQESASRASDQKGKKFKRYLREANFLNEKWTQHMNYDPSYNPNLTTRHEDFSFYETVLDGKKN